MIQKVSNQNKMSWVENGKDQSFSREGMNVSAVNSFESMVISSAQNLIAKGQSLNTIANKFNLHPEFLKGMLDNAKTKKLVCDCEDREPEMKSKKTANKNKELTDEELAAVEAYNSLHNIKASSTPVLPTNSSKRILSNKGNDVVDTGGALKQMGFERNNSIFDPEVISRQAKQQGNDEMIRQQAKERLTKREAAQQSSRYETIDGKSIVDILKETDQRKDAGIRSSGAVEAHKYNKKMPSNGISIFDTGDFDRVPEKTAGEQRREDIKNTAALPKDRSWVQSGSKTVKSSDIVSGFIDSMLNTKKKD